MAKVPVRKSTRPSGPYTLCPDVNLMRDANIAFTIISASFYTVAYIPCQTWPKIHPDKDMAARKIAMTVLKAFQKDYP